MQARRRSPEGLCLQHAEDREPGSRTAEERNEHAPLHFRMDLHIIISRRKFCSGLLSALKLLSLNYFTRNYGCTKAGKDVAKVRRQIQKFEVDGMD